MSETEPEPAPPSTDALLAALTQHADAIAHEMASHLGSDADLDQIRAIIAEARARLAAGGPAASLPIFMQASGSAGSLRGISLPRPDTKPEEPRDPTAG